MEHWQFWAFSFWFDIDSVRYRYFAIEGGFMIIDIPSRQCLHSHRRVASSTTTRTNVLREYLHENEQFRETIFGCLYGAQEEFFFLVLKISWHYSFKVVMLCSIRHERVSRFFYFFLNFDILYCTLYSTQCTVYSILLRKLYYNFKCWLQKSTKFHHSSKKHTHTHTQFFYSDFA